MRHFAIGPGAHRRTRIGFALAVGLVVLVAAAKAVLFDTIDPDCFWHLRVAEQIHISGIGPLVDRLSFASKSSPWTPYSWLAELAMRWVWNHCGWRGAVAAQSMLQAAFVIFLAGSCRARVDAPRLRLEPSGPGVARPGALQTVIAVAWGTTLTLPYLSFRPVTAALVLLAACAALLVRDRRLGERTWTVWLIVPLTALTINVHLYAAFVPLCVLTLLAGSIWERSAADAADRPEANRRLERYIGMFFATLAACAATPLLPGVLDTALHYQFSDVMVQANFITEMRPFYSGGAGHVAAVLVTIFACFAVYNHRRLRAGECIWLIFSALLLLRLGRFMPLFAIAAAPIFAAVLPTLSDKALGRPALCGAMALFLTIGLARVVAAFPSRHEQLAQWLNRNGPETPGYPCAAADFVENRLQPATGRLINEFSWGGYLEWRLGDRYQTLLDGRTQLFSPDFWTCTCLGSPADREHFLAQMYADAAVLPAQNSLFHDPLTRLGWKTVYRDDRAEVMVPPETAAMPQNDWPTASIFFGD